MTTSLDVTDFGAVPGGRGDAAPAIVAALQAATARAGRVTVRFPPGEYHLWPDGAPRRELYVSNTVGDDPAWRDKTIAVLVEAADDLVISGAGARLVLHGLQTTFAVIDSRRVRIEGLEFDFAVPTVVDATVVDAGVTAGRAFRVISVPEATLFSVEGRSVRWHGEPIGAGAYAWEGYDALEYSQVHDPAGGRTRRAPNPLFDRVRKATRVGRRTIRLDYDHGEAPADAGLVYQMRRTTRDHPGGLVLDSAAVTLSGVVFRFLHGFGIVAQASRDVGIESCEFRTPPGTGRHSAGFADFVQFSGCSGRAVVRDCLFDGPHDDPVNVHGTYLRVAGPARSPHPGAGVRAPGDGGHPPVRARGPGRDRRPRDAAADRRGGGWERVRQPSGRDHDVPLRTIVVTVGSALPGGLSGRAAVENVTRTPSVHLARNVFRNVPTRGVLVTTRRKVLIEDNRFERTGMSAVYVSGDATEWWESGPVRDLTVRGNEIVEPGGPAVFVDPRNPGSDPAHPVHHGVVVEGNRFVLDGVPALDAKDTGGLRFRDNAIAHVGVPAWDLVLRSCPGADVGPGEGGAPLRIMEESRDRPL
ncbi:hypothetical protein GCM10020220_026690 [Nonomuraea rubra]|uniref:right-handed parallel beta-helix repeat-containing protein n=1 Tax=Nonomuraea rubra TaxID=46180 RepID=UPI0031E9B5CB